MSTRLERLNFGGFLKDSIRAIGGANGSNPIPIIIPCHRVVGADGSLGGYSGGEGPATKRFLITLEAHAQGQGISR